MKPGEGKKKNRLASGGLRVRLLVTVDTGELVLTGVWQVLSGSHQSTGESYEWTSLISAVFALVNYHPQLLLTYLTIQAALGQQRHWLQVRVKGVNHSQLLGEHVLDDVAHGDVVRQANLLPHWNQLAVTGGVQSEVKGVERIVVRRCTDSDKAAMAAKAPN